MGILYLLNKNTCWQMIECYQRIIPFFSEEEGLKVGEEVILKKLKVYYLTLQETRVLALACGFLLTLLSFVG